MSDNSKRNTIIIAAAVGFVICVIIGFFAGISNSRKQAVETSANSVENANMDISEAEDDKVNTENIEKVDTEELIEEAKEEKKEREESKDVEVSADNYEKLSEEEAIKAMSEMLNEIFDYEYVLLNDEIWDDARGVGKSKDIKINVDEATRASVLSRSVSREENIIEFPEEMEGQYVNVDDVEEACRNLFGMDAQVENLPDEGNYFYDAVLFSGEPFVKWCVGETELDSVVFDTEYEVDENHYRSVQYVYQGYWGYRRFNKSNFKITVDYKPNSDSKYKLVISDISVERIENENTWSNADFEGFYGIWCSASENEEDASKVANDLIEKGFDAQVYISAEWENLNSKVFHVVTAGKYATEEDALKDLEAVKASGYVDAYIKYTGERIGY